MMSYGILPSIMLHKLFVQTATVSNTSAPSLQTGGSVNILKLNILLHSQYSRETRKKVVARSNGEKVRFWEDNWLGTSSLAIQYWKLYRFVNGKIDQ